MEYKVIVIDNYWNVKEEQAAIRMGQILNIKKAAYSNGQSENYLPVGTDDYYCIHVIICEKFSGDPIFTFKVVPNSYSKKFINVQFPVDYFANGTCNELDKVRLTKLMQQMNDKYSDFSYSGGWAMGKQFRGLGLSKEFRDVYTGIHYNLHKEYGLGAMFAIGLIDSGTYDFFKTTWNTPRIMDTKYTLPGFNGCECYFIHQEFHKFSDAKVELGKKYDHLWSQREVFGDPIERVSQTELDSKLVA